MILGSKALTKSFEILEKVGIDKMIINSGAHLTFTQGLVSSERNSRNWTTVTALAYRVKYLII